MVVSLAQAAVAPSGDDETIAAQWKACAMAPDCLGSLAYPDIMAIVSGCVNRDFTSSKPACHVCDAILSGYYPLSPVRIAIRAAGEEPRDG
jgi:hypothetical protein